MKVKKTAKTTIKKKNKKGSKKSEEPMVKVLNLNVNPENPRNGFFELDWNDEFVAMLSAKGYTGESDESVVNGWFNDVCRTVLLDELQDQDYGMESRDDVVVINNNDEDNEG